MPESLKRLLITLSLHLDGALEDLDRLFAPLRFSAAGVHGCERRESNGCIVRPPLDTKRLDPARSQLAGFVALGRTPIYIGDDLTDEGGFAVVNDLGGISIRVGDAQATLARHRLPGVRQVLRWLESIPLPSFEYEQPS